MTPSNTDKNEDFLRSGALRAPHGVKGLISVQSYSGEVEHLLKAETWLLEKDGKRRHYKVERASPSPGGLWVKLEGIDSPEAALPLRGAEILLPRAEACPLAADEFYVVDLEGCSLISGGEVAGKVVSVSETGAADLLEVEKTSGGRAYVPFRSEYLGKVDLEAKTIELVAPWILD